MPPYTEAELSILTDDERDALLSGDTPPADDPVVDAAAPDAVADAAAAEASAAQEEVPPAVAEDSPAPVADFQPEFKTAAPEGLADSLTALEKTDAELMAKFQAGDLEVAEYLAQRQAIDSQRLTLKLAETQAKWAAEQNEAIKAQRWQWEQERFFSAKTAEIYKDPLIAASLDVAVKQLAGAAENATKPQSWFLEEADRMVRARFNLGSVPVVAAAAKPADLQKPPPPAPRTLSGLPAAAPNPTGHDIREKMAMLEGEDAEEYFARLPAGDREKLLRGAA